MTDSKTKFQTIQHSAADADGWTEWVSPNMNGYLMVCCDCNLTHEVQFQVVKFVDETSGEYEEVHDKNVQTLMRVRRRDELEATT